MQRRRWAGRPKRFWRIIWQRFFRWGLEQLGFLFPIILAVLLGLIVTIMWYHTLWPIGLRYGLFKMESAGEDELVAASVGPSP